MDRRNRRGREPKNRRNRREPKPKGTEGRIEGTEGPKGDRDGDRRGQPDVTPSLIMGKRQSSSAPSMISAVSTTFLRYERETASDPRDFSGSFRRWTGTIPVGRERSCAYQGLKRRFNRRK